MKIWITLRIIISISIDVDSLDSFGSFSLPCDQDLRQINWDEYKANLFCLVNFDIFFMMGGYENSRFYLKVFASILRLKCAHLQPKCTSKTNGPWFVRRLMDLNSDNLPQLNWLTSSSSHACRSWRVSYSGNLSNQVNTPALQWFVEQREFIKVKICEIKMRYYIDHISIKFPRNFYFAKLAKINCAK